MKITREQVYKLQEEKNKKYHLSLIKEVGKERAIRTIKKQIPEGMKLKEYLEILQEEITKE